MDFGRSAMKRKPRFVAFYGYFRLTCIKGTHKAIRNRLAKLNRTTYMDTLMIFAANDSAYERPPAKQYGFVPHV